MNNKVLIITYYWPPSGGPGVQRVLKFSKYLPEFGWDVIVLTVKRGSYPYIDESLVKEINEPTIVYKSKNLEPIQLYKRFVGMKDEDPISVATIGDKNASFRKKIANIVRLNLFIPDAKVGWVFGGVKKGLQIIKEYKPAVIISSSPPPTVHLIAQKLAKRTGIKWIADFRDPWTNIYHYDRSKRLAFFKHIDQRLETRVLKDCDVVLHSSMSMRNSLLIRSSKRSITLLNGFDPQDFSSSNENLSFDKFTIAYAGRMSSFANPQNLFAAIDKMDSTYPDFRDKFQLLFMGNIANEIWSSIQKRKWSAQSKNLGHIPHRDCLQNVIRSHMLLLVTPDTKKNHSIIPSKIYEYIAAQRFILSIGPVNSDTNTLLEKAHAGKTVEYSDFNSTYTILETRYLNWLKGDFQLPNSDKLHRFSRREQSMQLSQILDEISDQK